MCFLSLKHTKLLRLYIVTPCDIMPPCVCDHILYEINYINMTTHFAHIIDLYWKNNSNNIPRPLIFVCNNYWILHHSSFLSLNLMNNVIVHSIWGGLHAIVFDIDIYTCYRGLEVTKATPSKCSRAYYSNFSFTPITWCSYTIIA